MNSHTMLFGLYVPGDSPLHRTPSGLKYLLMLVGAIVPFIVQSLWFSLGLLVAAVLLLTLVARLPVRPALRLPWPFWLMMACLLAYHTWFTSWQTGAIYLVSLLCAIYFSRIVIMTTPASELMDAIATAFRPLKIFGVRPERIALAVSLMWRSIPYLLGSVADVRDAARARGLERSVSRFIVPVVISAVGYALATSDALKARGLDG